MLSARNQLPGKVVSVKLAEVMAEVVIDVGGSQVVAAITRSSAEQMNLRAGANVQTVGTPTEAMVQQD